jgi:hypothetical protein
MKALVISAAILASTSTASAQELQPTLAQRRSMELDKALLEGKLRAAVEMRTITGAPYSAEATTEFQQTLADGNRIVRKSIVRVYRDAEGRVRRENVTADGTTIESVTIVDPTSDTSVILEPGSRAAIVDNRVRVVLRERSGSAPAVEIERKKAVEREMRRKVESKDLPSLSAVPKARTSMANELVARQDLGERIIGGVNARGTRTTTTIPAGAIGNDQPIRIVSEEWFSPDLQVLVLTKHSDPRSGESTYTLANIIRSEPDRALFEIPADYTRK